MRLWPRTRRGRLLAILAPLVLWVGGTLAVSWRLTRRPGPPFEEPVPGVEWGVASAHRLTTDDGETLGAWHFAARRPRGSVLLLHGLGGCRSTMLREAELFVRADVDVLAVTLRCHGDSTGETIDFGRSSAADVLAGVAFLEARRPGGKIVITGTSLGAAAAIFAARRLGLRVSGYVLDCLYTDLATAVRNRTVAYLPPGLDAVAAWSLMAAARVVVEDAHELAPIRRVNDIDPSVPVLFLAGGDDDRATPDDVRALQGEIAAQASIEVLEGARHSMLHADRPGRYAACVLDFLDRCFQE